MSTVYGRFNNNVRMSLELFEAKRNGWDLCLIESISVDNSQGELDYVKQNWSNLPHHSENKMVWFGDTARMLAVWLWNNPHQS